MDMRVTAQGAWLCAPAAGRLSSEQRKPAFVLFARCGV